MTLHEIAIFTDNVTVVVDFYERLLNVGPAYRGKGIAIFQVGDAQILIHERYVPGPEELPCENHTAFAVPDVDAAVDQLSRRGVSIEFPPRDYDWGRSAYLRDPEGRLLELYEHRE